MDKIKITMGLIFDQLFIAALTQFCSKSLPPKASFQLSNCLKTINAASEEGIKARDKAIKEYGVPVKETNEYTFTDENRKKVNKDLADLSEIEVELPISEKVKISLAKLEEIKVNVAPFEFDPLSNLVEFVD